MKCSPVTPRRVDTRPPATHRSAAPRGRDGPDWHQELAVQEFAVSLRARDRSLGLGTLLIFAGILIATIVAIMSHGAGTPVGLIGGEVAPVGLIGGGINLIRFGGRPPDGRHRSA
jgi:hypothetical protein